MEQKKHTLKKLIKRSLVIACIVCCAFNMNSGLYGMNLSGNPVNVYAAPKNSSGKKTSINNKSVFAMKKTVYVLKKGKKVKMHYTIASRYKKKKITWSSSKKSVATVSKTGVVKAKKKGKTVIKARIKGAKYVAKCVLIVGNPVSAIKVSSHNLSMKKGQHVTVKAKITPSNASKKKLKFISYNKKVVTVSSSGVITALATGTTRIKIESTDGHNVTTYIHVNVKKSDSTNTTTDSTLNSGTTNTASTTTGSWDASSYDKKAKSTALKNSQKLLIYMEKYSAFIKYFGALCYKSKSATVLSYEAALAKVSAGTMIGINCASPLNWALREMGLETTDGEVHGTYFNGFSITPAATQTLLDNNATFIKKGNAPVGLSIQAAAKKNYLQAGDILSVNKYIDDTNTSHTVVYYGLSSKGQALVYEAGNIPYMLGYAQYGCGTLDYSSYSTFYITEVMRLR